MSDKSILVRLEEAGQPATRVDLRGTDRQKGADTRYSIVGELARGGVGVVHHGRDNDLGRDVALKELREEYLANPELVRRFVEEAQIGAQLQHPGIVPVYELGLKDDRRPFFAMKLVKGKTLAARLAEREDPGDGRRNLLAIFREACRTVAYAHARAVIHRDLKPSNIMIGSFGEVQVVDWGFAKVLRRGGIADEQLAKKAERMSTIIATVRSDQESVAGSVMGTPAYMPPEQALGHVDDLDPRSDVFCLGGILCEILTGDAPFRHIQDATHCSLDDAHARLDACGADEKLVSLCRRALAPLPKDRPASAEVLADEVAAYLAQAEGRAHRMALHAATASARAEQKQRARRFTGALVAASLAAVALVGGTFFWIDHQQAERDRRHAASVAAAEREATRAQAAGDLDAALTAAQHARDLGGDVEILLADLRQQADEKVKADRRDALADKLVTELHELEIMWLNPEFDQHEIDARRVALLEKHGVTLATLHQRFAGSPRARELAAAIDSWAFDRSITQFYKDADYKGLFAAARRLDPQDNDLRRAIEAVEANKEQVDALADTANLARQSPLHTAIAMQWLFFNDHKDKAEALARAAHRQNPGNFWINLRLGEALLQRNKIREALRYYEAALGLRPDSVEVIHRLGVALGLAGEPERSIALFRAALKRRPSWAHGHAHVAQGLIDLGKHDKAWRAVKRGFAVGDDYKLYVIRALLHWKRGDYERAIADAEVAKKRKPGQPHPNLALYHAEIGDYERAEEEIAQAQKLSPENPDVWMIRGRILRRKGELKEARAACWKALRLNKRSGAAWAVIAGSYYDEKNTAQAVKAQGKVIELAPKSGEAWHNYALFLYKWGKIDDAMKAAEHATRLDERRGWSVRAKVLCFQRKEYAKALAAIDHAVEHWAHNWDYWGLKAEILLAAGKPEKAVGAWEEAARRARTKTDKAKCWVTVGVIRNRLGQYDVAIEAADRAFALNGNGLLVKAIALMGKKEYEAAVEAVARLYVDPPTDPAQRWANLATWMGKTGHGDHRIFAAKRAVQLDRKNTRGWGQLAAGLFKDKSDYKGAYEAASRLLALHGGDGSAWYIKGASAEELGRSREAFVCYSEMAKRYNDPAVWVRMVHNMAPDSYIGLTEVAWRIGRFDLALASAKAEIRKRPTAGAYHVYGTVLWAHGRLRKAADAFNEAIRRKAKHWLTWQWLASQLMFVGDFKQARDRLRESPDDEVIRRFLARMERFVALEPQLERIVRGDLRPKNEKETKDFAFLCHHKGKHEAATRLFREAGPAGRSPTFSAPVSAVLAGELEQGLAWMREYLERVGKQELERRVHILEKLRLDPELASVRDGKAVPEEWRALWAEIDAWIARERNG